MQKAIKTGMIDRNKYTKAGYRIDENRECCVCDGHKMITVVL